MIEDRDLKEIERPKTPDDPEFWEGKTADGPINTFLRNRALAKSEDSSDRIFLNTKTGELLLSIRNGMMREGGDWKQIGIIDTSQIPNFKGEGLITVS